MESTVFDHEEGQQKEDDSESDGDDSDDEHESVEFLPERGFGVAAGGCEIGNLSHDGVGSDVDHNTSSSSLFAEGAEEG